MEKNVGDAVFQNIEELEKVHNDFVAEFVKNEVFNNRWMWFSRFKYSI